MERRELLKRGVVFGTALVADQGARSGAAASAPAVSFFEGECRGREFPGWQLFFSLTGSRVQGRADGPAIRGGTPGEIRGLRLLGRLQNGGLQADVFPLDDVNLSRSIGVADGLLSRQGVLKGTVRLGSGSTAAFHARVVPLDSGAAGQLPGLYRGSIQDQGGAVLYTGDLTIRPDQSWELRNLAAASSDSPMLIGSTARRLGGRWAVAADGRVLLSITQVPFRLRQQPASVAPGARRARPLAQSKLQFSDTEFPDANWTAALIFDNTQAATFEANQETRRGNPGAFRRTRITHHPGSGQVAHVLRAAEYVRTDPAQPPITGLRYVYDVMSLDATGQGTAFFPLLVYTPPAGEPSYYWAAGIFAPGEWTRVGTVGNLNFQSFNKIIGPGPGRLDETLLGTFQFGFVTGFDQPQGPDRTDTSGIDNFLVEITTGVADEPVSIELTGPESATIGEEVFYTATVRNAGGGPFAGAIVLLSATDEPDRVLTTDASGKVTIRFVVTAAGVKTITACLDRNRNFTCEPDEPSAEITLTIIEQTTRVKLSGPTRVLRDPTTTIQYDVLVTDALDRPVAGQDVHFRTDEDDGSEHGDTDQLGHISFTRFPWNYSSGTILSATAWLEENRNGQLTPGEPSATIQTEIAFNPCDWLCVMVSPFGYFQPRPPDVPSRPGPEPLAFADGFCVQHPFLQNLILCAEPAA